MAGLANYAQGGTAGIVSNTLSMGGEVVGAFNLQAVSGCGHCGGCDNCNRCNHCGRCKNCGKTVEQAPYPYTTPYWVSPNTTPWTAVPAVTYTCNTGAAMGSASAGFTATNRI